MQLDHRQILTLVWFSLKRVMLMDVIFSSWSCCKDTFFCRRNCRGNPNCLVGIGEQAWLGEIDENAFHNIDDPNSERRDKVLLLNYLHIMQFVCSLSFFQL